MFDLFLLVADKDETGKEKQSPRQEDSPPTSPNDEDASPAPDPSASPPPPPSDGGGAGADDDGRGHPSPPDSYRSSGEEQERAAASSSAAAIGQPGASSAASSLVPSPLDMGGRDSPSPLAAAASPEGEESRAVVAQTGSGEVVTGPPSSGQGICQCFRQCCGSMTFWGGSGSADPCL